MTDSDPPNEPSQRQPSSDDRFLAARLKGARIRLGRSQASIASAIGVSVHQVQKYEGGVNRVSATRLEAIARAMGIPVGSLLYDVELPVEEARLLAAFRKLTDIEMRETVLTIIEALVQRDIERSRPIDDEA